MIVGIGTDLIEIDRVIKACGRKGFIEKYFTKEEQKLFKNNLVRAADNFAVKEAVSKVFGTGFRTVKLIEIEVLRDSLGKPYIKLYGNALDLANQMGIGNWQVSISNTKELASAFVIGEQIGNPIRDL